jgi:hypothetical protein
MEGEQRMVETSKQKTHGHGHGHGHGIFILATHRRA